MKTSINAIQLVVLCAGVLALDLAAAQETNERSDEEIARELANPNTALASVKFKLQHRIYKGDLPDVDGEDSTILLFQPTLPFPLKNGKTLFVRPGIPLIFDQPVADGITFTNPGYPSIGLPDPGEIEFSSKSGIGDTTFDVQYGTTTETGFLWSYGATMTAPTANKGLGTDKWALGPGFQLGKVTKKYVIGGFANHQWDIAGSGDTEINLTTVQFFGVFLPSGGWAIASSPIMSFNHETDDWTIPVNFAVSKTTKLNGRPWKFAVEMNYYVDQPDLYGPEWMIGFIVTPVVTNKMAEWFR